MKNKTGFTLMELIAVIAILGILTIVAVPAVLSVSNKVKDNLLQSKVEYAKQALLLWSQDNKKCYFDGGTNCLPLVCTGEDEKICYVSLNSLANYGLIDYDNDKKQILNPVNKKSMGNSSISIKYSPTNKSFEILGFTLSYSNHWLDSLTIDGTASIIEPSVVNPIRTTTNTQVGIDPINPRTTTKYSAY